MLLPPTPIGKKSEFGCSMRPHVDELDGQAGIAAAADGPRIDIGARLWAFR